MLPKDLTAKKQRNPLFSMAPMHRITDRLFRQTLREFSPGIAVYYSPFVTTIRDGVDYRRKTADILPAEPDLVPQILSSDPRDMKVLATELAAAGYTQVNWNLGCPWPAITGKGKGAALLADSATVKRGLDLLCPVLPVSLKIRTGFSGLDDAFCLLQQLGDYPLTEVIVHPRTAAAGYTGPLDLEQFTRVYSLLTERNIPVHFSGDITGAESIQALRQRFPELQRFMLGRGLIADPLLAERIGQDLGLQEETEEASGTGSFYSRFTNFVTAFELALFSQNGPAAIRRLKGFWRYWAGDSGPRGVDRRLLDELLRCSSWDDYRRLSKAMLSCSTV